MMYKHHFDVLELYCIQNSREDYALRYTYTLHNLETRLVQNLDPRSLEHLFALIHAITS